MTKLKAAIEKHKKEGGIYDQSKLARLLSISKSMMSLYCSGRATIPAEHKTILATALGYKVEVINELFDEEK